MGNTDLRRAYFVIAAGIVISFLCLGTFLVPWFDKFAAIAYPLRLFLFLVAFIVAICGIAMLHRALRRT